VVFYIYYLFVVCIDGKKYITSNSFTFARNQNYQYGGQLNVKIHIKFCGDNS
jgi:hypothetical protein